MNNADKPAYPCSVAVTAMGDTIGSWDIEGGEGLTKREYFAAMAMQGILSNEGLREKIIKDQYIDGTNADNQFAVYAVKQADELLKQLEPCK